MIWFLTKNIDLKKIQSPTIWEKPLDNYFHPSYKSGLKKIIIKKARGSYSIIVFIISNPTMYKTMPILDLDSIPLNLWTGM